MLSATMAVIRGSGNRIERCGPVTGRYFLHLSRTATIAMLKLDSDNFRVTEGETVQLAKRPTNIDPLYESKKDYRELLKQQVKQLAVLQQLQYAADSHAVLLIFQAMDAAGKDGTIRHVMSGVNPQGFQVYSFKQPSATELEHDFLWRTTLCLPERGRIGVFNRSYYEDVLVVRVHPELLRRGFNADAPLNEKTIWRERFRSITDFERHLHANGTRVIKFYLHLSKDEQRRRFLDRIDETDKHWKFNASDIAERAFWSDYMKAYEECLSVTSTTHAPWYVVPADDKKNARLIVADIIVRMMGSLEMTIPESSGKRRKELQLIRKALAK